MRFVSYGTTEQWWRDNCDLPNYYNYRAIVDCIHHYDIGDGKNYFYYHNPTDQQVDGAAVGPGPDLEDHAYRADTGIAGLAPFGQHDRAVLFAVSLAPPRPHGHPGAADRRCATACARSSTCSSPRSRRAC